MKRFDETVNEALNRRKRRPSLGLPPGTLSADPAAPKPVVRIFGYSPDDYEEKQILLPDEIPLLRKKWPTLWVNVDGLGDADTIAQIGEIFDLHRLALEDVIHVHQRAKVDEYDKHLFMSIRMLTHNSRLESEQVSMFLGKGYVLSFQEHVGDCLESVRDRIRNAKGRIRSADSDYLAYALLDAVIDGYFPVLEQIGDRIETMDTDAIERPNNETMLLIRSIKRDLLTFRRDVWPLREVINTLLRDGVGYFAADTGVYLRDCYDHAVQVIDIIETQREMASGLMDVYMSSLSNRMNEVMKVLTIFASIFIPLTFIAGIYGMNFNPDASRWNMPELNAAYGYPVTMAFMAVIALVMLSFFWRRGWLGRR